MNNMIGFCGMSCHECGAYIATKENNDKKREEVAKLWSKEYNTGIKPEDINCDGCTSRSNNVFSHTKVCEIRKCGISKDLINCAHCDEYACEQLLKFFEMVPDAKKTLDGIRANF